MKKLLVLAMMVGAMMLCANDVTDKTVLYADNFPNLQAAVDALPTGGGKVIMSARTYKLDKPLNLTNTYNNGQKTKWITIEGAGKMNTVITGDFPDDAVIDATCAGFLTMRDFTISGKSKSLMLCARTKGAGGGGHNFENLMFRGDNVLEGGVLVWLIGSECDRFINCQFQVGKPNSVCVAFTPIAEFTAAGVTHQIKSSYEPNMTGSSTTELRFYGCVMGSGTYNSIGLYTQGSNADISIFGGYWHNSGFAAIYLDGTRANVGDTAIRDLRIEGECGKYGLYATGAVRNVLIDSGNWGAAGEVIRYEKSPDGTHGANCSAENWVIRNCSLTIQDQDIRKPEWDKNRKNSGEELNHIGRESRSIIRADKMVNSKVENIWVRAYEIVRKKVPKDQSLKGNTDFATVTQNIEFTESEVLEYYNPKLVTIVETASNNYLQSEEADRIVLPVDSTGNIIDVLKDGGIHRRYLTYGNVTNLSVQTVSSIKSPKSGDTILVKRAGALAIAVYDGNKWVYFKSE